MNIFVIILALFFVIVTALPLLRFDQWWIRAFDFPRIQIAVGGIIVLAIYVYLWDVRSVFQSLLLVLLSLAMGYQVLKILPYTFLMPKQTLDADSVSTEATISILVANVLIENRQSNAFLDVVQKYDPDLILTVETDDWWEKALTVLEEDYPYTLKRPLDNAYGMLVYSRLEIIDPKIRFILKETIPSMHMQVLLPSNDRVYMHFVHPNPPNPIYSTETTERDAELLIVGREAEQHGEPTIVAGDFNDVAWSYTTTLFQKASGLLDPRIGRGMYNTYNAKIPFMRWPLDHVFHSDHFKLIRMDTGPAWGSDHFPIFIELSLEPGAEVAQDEPDADPEEENQVDRMITDGRQKEDS